METVLKNLTQKYRKISDTTFPQVVNFKSLSQIKDRNTISSNNRETWEYFDDIDAILGTRSTSSPIPLVHSGADDISQVPSSALNGNE